MNRMKNQRRILFVVAIATMLSLLVACGNESPSTNIYTVGGIVTGLPFSGKLVLQNNGGDSLTLLSNVPFSFPNALADGDQYRVTVLQQPTGRNCSVGNDFGTIRTASISNIQITCITDRMGGVTLSGRIAVPQGIMADSSVNDSNDKYVNNETFESAQVLPNPIAVGGYVNRRMLGKLGRSFLGGNTDDYYRVQLKAGDVITLAIGELNTYLNDLDLCLYDNNRNLVDCSIGTGPYEILAAPSGGTYFVNVYAYYGASNYILTIGADMADLENVFDSAEILSSQYEIVPDQVIVRFRDETNNIVSNQSFWQSSDGMELTAIAGVPEKEMLMTINDLKYQTYVNDPGDVFQQSYKRKTDDDSEKMRQIDTLMAIKELRKQPDVLIAEPNYIVHSYSTVPNDPDYASQWGLPMIDLPEAWDVTTGSNDVIVAVVDSGVLLKHPDLQTRLTDGRNFVSDANGYVNPSPDDPGDKCSEQNASSFHGTHVAGIIAAEANDKGTVGVTWNTKIMPVRVMGECGRGNIYDVRDGIRYAARIANSSGTLPEKHADIINLSLGGPGYSSIDQGLMNDVRNINGIIVVAAAGNENTTIPSYPASYDGVISVSSVGKDGLKASYSNYGSRIAVAAPGGSGGSNGILSTDGDDSGSTIEYVYKYKSGTSMASPHVAGVVALMKAVYSTMSPEEFDALLNAGSITNNIGNAGGGRRDNYYGYGLIDAFKAVNAAQILYGGGSITGLDVTPGTINLGVFGLDASITVSQIGTDTDDELFVEDVNTSADWLTVTPDSVDDHGFGRYNIHVDRSMTSLRQDGVYKTVVTFTTSSGISVSTSVTVQVRSNVMDYDVGYHYVLLVNAEGKTVDQYDVKSSDGYYYYVFYNVQPGRYMIFAGTDRNCDGAIDDWGEAFGAYPSVDQIDLIDVSDSDMNNLDFTTNLRYPLSYPYSTSEWPWIENMYVDNSWLKRISRHY